MSSVTQSTELLTVYVYSFGWWLVCAGVMIELALILPWVRWIGGVLEGLAITITALFDESLSDEEREVALRRAALRMLGETFKGGLYLGVLIGSIFGLQLLSDELNLPSLFTPPAIVGLTLIGALYAWIRLRLSRRDVETAEDGRAVKSEGAPASSSDDYSALSQDLHRFALDHTAVARLSFKWRQRRIRRAAARIEGRASASPVWVCGLARAGTTILTNVLYETGQFGSLTYRDMPFTLAPKYKGESRLFWREPRARGPLKERAHGDGLLVGVDSPEALEEIFWRTFEPHVYADERVISSYQPSSETLKLLKSYIESVTLSYDPVDPPRYLSKNNNHLIRLPSLIEALPDATFVIPVRDPLEHAESLRRQHLRWVERHARDDFSRRYMGWLGHHEFGADHKPFRFDQSELDGGVTSEESSELKLSKLKSTQLDYWLAHWIAAHEWIAALRGPQVYLVDAQRLTSEPYHTLEALAQRLELNLNQDELKRLSSMISSAPRRADEREVDAELSRRAYQLHRELTHELTHDELTHDDSES